MALFLIYAIQVLLLLDIDQIKAVDSFKQGLTRMSVHRNSDTAVQNMMSINMFKIYEKFSKEKYGHVDENTVRSFKAVSEFFNNKVLFYFNLTSIPESEVILSASLHFLDQHGRQRPWSCRRARGSSCRIQHLQLVLQGASQNMASPFYLGNITLSPHRKGPWQVIDVSSFVQQARTRNELFISAELHISERHQWRHEHFFLHGLPYILVYANDLAITEPNSIAMGLQRYSPFPVGEERITKPPIPTPSSRIRRNTDPLQNNLLPDVQHGDLKNKELWYNTYFALKAKPSSKNQGERQGQEIKWSRSQELSFDERTMKKARRKQWSEPRACARRYLRVDFADIGWSEWILAPKAFDAFYCGGTCGFPMSKVVHPSNHATIQSIVRAVGIVPGVPEPCCVADKMSPLAVLFLDTSRNMVLKVYPSMAVETCACR
ncbi:growth/differentiation factor 10 [Brachyhypopomus gauderio]|uniref:growth/differentiation factor 10 n=1 Tax=Brachyhypopomus gauderio TaxID=698409 RepID=UPI004043939F